MTTKLLIIGEAPSEIEGSPLSGGAEYLFFEMLQATGIDPETPITNVFNEYPPKANIKAFFSKDYRAESPFSKYQGIGHVKADKEHHLVALAELIKNTNPNLILALGSTALWALTGEHKITDYRGTIIPSIHGPKVLPTIHPLIAVRDFSLRAPLFADLSKAIKEQEYPEIKPSKKKIWIADKLSDLDLFYNLFLKKADRFAYDVETNYHKKEITCISIAPNPQVALVIPFVTPSGGSYWLEPEQEAACLSWLAALFADQRYKKIAHNALYDLSYITHYGILPRGELHDTMILHHTLQPELRKSLGFLSSLYLNNTAWKHYRTQSKKDVNKADD